MAGIYFSGTIGIAYRVCLWSRLANKVLLPLASFEAESQEALILAVNPAVVLDRLATRAYLWLRR